MEIDVDSFSDFLSIKNPQGLYLGDLLYLRIKDSIDKKKKKASVYSKSNDGNIFVCSLDSDHFHIFLQAYLKMCENREEYEICSDVLNLIELK